MESLINSPKCGGDTVSNAGPLHPESLSFSEYVREAHRCARNDTLPSIIVKNDAISLFGRLPKSFLKTIGVLIDKRYCFIQYLCTSDRLKVIKSTYWYKRLSSPARHRIRCMVSDDRILDLKELLNTVDGALISLYCSFDTDFSYRDTDAITNSLISNIIFDKTFLSRWKKFKKQLRKSMLSNTEPPKVRKEYSWISRYLKLIDKENQSRYKEVCILNFCQTRNTGLNIDRSAEIQSLKEWLGIVQEPSLGYKGERIKESLTPILDRFLSKEGIIRGELKSHLSISGNACYESGRASSEEKARNIPGGKIRMALLCLLTVKSVNRIDLHSGEITKDLISKDDFGEFIFHRSILMFKNRYKHFHDVKVNVIREPGPKNRVTTSSSFFHAEFLQPWSHITLAVLYDCEGLKSGLKQSRHGWNTVKDLDSGDPSLAWIMDSLEEGRKLYGLSTDLHQSTDHIDWFVIRDIIDTINYVIGIPKWYGDSVKYILSHERNIFFRGELIGKTKRAAFMGDPGTKTVLSLISLMSYGAAYRMNQNIFYRGVGDDIIAISDDINIFNIMIEELMRLSMMISEDDTYISEDYVYFTEELIRIPKRRSQMTNFVMRSKCFGNLLYVDIVKGRLLIEAMKNRDDYAYTPTGRITQLGRDIEYLRPQLCESLFHLASSLQDVCLHNRDYEGSVYFPNRLLGEGKVPLFWKWENALLFWLGQCGGKYIEKILSMVYELNYISANNVSDRKQIPLYLQKTFIGQYRHEESMPYVVSDIPIPDEYNSAIVGQVSKFSKTEIAVIGRLGSYLMSESELIGKLAKQSLIDHVLTTGLLVPEKQQNLKSIIISEQIIPTKEELINFFILWKSTGFSLIKGEIYYDREIVENILGKNYPLKVNIRLSPPSIYRPAVEARTTPERQSSELYTWFKTRQGPCPRQALDDDVILIDSVKDTFEFQEYYIISDDIKLVKEISRLRHPRKTYRIPMIDWLMCEGDRRKYHPLLFSDKHPVTKQLKENFAVDTGSYDTVLARVDDNGNFSKPFDPKGGEQYSLPKTEYTEWIENFTPSVDKRRYFVPSGSVAALQSIW